jgi:prepilin-type N-terminal cleavage/methylation domain-containing protein
MFTYFNRLRSKKGFSLIELVVVIGIISIMTAVAVPNYITSQRNAMARNHNDAARTFYLAAQQALANVMQNDNTTKELRLNVAGQTRHRANGIHTIAGLPDNFFLYIVVQDGGLFESAQLSYGTAAAPFGNVIAQSTGSGFNDTVLADVMVTLRGYIPSVAAPGHYYVMFDSDFRVLVTYYAEFTDLANAQSAGFIVTRDNIMGGRTFGAFPRQYTFTGDIGTIIERGGAPAGHTARGSGFAWFTNLIPGI